MIHTSTSKARETETCTPLVRGVTTGSGDVPAIVRPSRAARTRLVAWGAGTAIGLASLGVFLATGPGGSGAGKPAPTKQEGGKANKSVGTLDVVEAQRMSFDITTTALGEMKAKNQVELRNELDSETTVTEIVAEGTVVKKGDVLVKLNSESIQQRLDEESLQLETARAQLVEAEQGYAIQVSENDSALRGAQLKLSLAELDLQKWRQGEVESKRQELDHDLDRTKKDELRLREKLDKSRELQGKGYYSLDQLKQDELAWEQAKAALAKAELAKTVYWQFEHPKDEKTKMSAVDEARAELDRTIHLNESKLASKDAERKNRQQSLAIREQSVAKYRKQVENAEIVAPQDGLVVYATSVDNNRWGGDEGPLQIGSKVWPNQSLIVLPDTSEMVASVRVHESLASRIRPGQRATVKVDAVGDRRFQGTVEGVGVLAEQTSRWMDPNLREYSVRILVDKDLVESTATSGQKLRPSMRCEAEVMLGRVEDAIAVPIQSVFNEGVLRYVHISDGSSRFVRRPVALGQRSDRFAQILAGLKEGERVLLRKPDAGEVVNRPWTSEELAAVGLELDDKGQIVMGANARGPGGMGRPGGGEGAGGAGRRPGAGGPGAGGPGAGGAAVPGVPGTPAPANAPQATPAAAPADGTTPTPVASPEGTPAAPASPAAAPATAPAGS